MISTLSVVFMFISGILCFALPIAAAIIWRKRTQADILPTAIGCGVFIIFPLILESILHSVVLGSSVGTSIQESYLLYALYSGLAAGVFEETGRYLAFRTVLRDSRDRNDSVMYGIGHGGVEAILIVGCAMLSYAAIALMANSGSLETLFEGMDEASRETLDTTIAQLSSSEPASYLMSFVERFLAFTAHICLSFMVWLAAIRKRHILFPVAILIHAAMDAGILLISSFITNIYAIEGILTAITALIVLFTAYLWKNDAEKYPAEVKSKNSNRLERVTLE